MTAGREGLPSAAASGTGRIFEVFDLTVHLGAGLVPWISAVSRLGHVHGIPRRDPRVPPLDDLLDNVYDFVDSVHFAEREPDPEIAAALGQLVFGEPVVLELFQATRGAASDHGRELLIRILASPHLAVLPWELLPDPGQRGVEPHRRYLTLAPDANVVRLARGRTYPVRAEPLKPPLNLLVVLSSPMDHNPTDDSLTFDIYGEKAWLMAELAPLVEAGLLSVDIEDHPTLENLRRRIGAQRRGYHLFHYLGHAEPDRLLLEDEEGRRDDYSGARFTEILQLCPDLRLAVLAGCQTARAAGDPTQLDAATAVSWRNMLSLADRCVQESSPMVIGMQAVLPFRTERLFTRFFYQGLVSGYSVAAAVRLARGATRGDRHVGGDLLDWAVPVLFVSGAEPNPILESSARGTPPKRPPRHVLRLGLRQRETRFYAREVALRQAIDVLTGATPERLLVVTGPTGVGKTLLIDRALEELGGPIFQLYVTFAELVPQARGAFAAAAEDDGNGARSWSLTQLAPDAAVERLCELIAELLSRGDGKSRAREPGWSPERWWTWLIEDLTTHRSVIAIDDYDVLSQAEEALVRRLLPAWLTPLLERSRATATNADDAPEPLEELIEHLRGQPGAGCNGNVFVDSLDELAGLLGTKELSRTAQDALVRAAERLFEHPGHAPRKVSRPPSVPSPQEQEALRDELGKLMALRASLADALRRVAERRSSCRVVIAASQLPEDLLELPSDQRFIMRIGHLTWAETWRWIRRNLPGLLRYGETSLGHVWWRLGPDLEGWEELERRILAARLHHPATPQEPISKLVEALQPRRASAHTADVKRGERPLRIAAAGPLLAGPQALASAVSRLAADHSIGGRVLPGPGVAPGTLAVLIEVPSPFAAGGAHVPDVMSWLTSVYTHEPDVVLLDFAANPAVAAMHETFDQLLRGMLRPFVRKTLLIAAGGDLLPPETPEVPIPAAYPFVLGVGPLGADRQLQGYSVWAANTRKPDLFMSDQLIGTPLEDALSKDTREKAPESGRWGPGTHGSGLAALHAVAAAILVWSTLPDLSPRGVRSLLETASTSVKGHPEPAPRSLTIVDALAKARRRLVRRALDDGPCSLQTLAAITGLDLMVADGTLKALIERRRVRRLRRGRLDLYELVDR